MPYQPGQRLPGERASRLGHLDVLKSPLVRQLCEVFEDTEQKPNAPQVAWESIDSSGEPLALIFAVDGSLQILESRSVPHKTIAFVKTALLRVDQHALSAIDRANPHPFALRDLMSDSAMYHATAFPMRHVTIPGTSVYDAVRHIIMESLKDPLLDGEVFETLKWIAYEKWSDEKKPLDAFQCPHCSNETELAFDADAGPCTHCGAEVLISDMLGFHLEMSEDAASDSVPNAYMLVHETLLLFTGIRYFWDKNRDLLKRALFLKDGPLYIRAQYSKLVNPIRRFLAFARDKGVPICIVGQEKTGAFADHMDLIGTEAPAHSIFVPGHTYIREQIQHRPVAGAPYGKDTNYGAKVFVKLNDRHQMVLNIPVGEFSAEPHAADLIGAASIFATLPLLISAKYQNALYPIELANSIASLSTYPSARVLSLFAEAKAAP